ncbi:aminopeptidase P family protein [Segnochrobactrum spirostomi]|uniref:Aminopeptidase P family protein n=1 Tax=Segnochrobactrum spirostomi TaxID=2608987 RepID=A0A6A7Y697_9HYPH|nr:aminopeptidase P family protein [Segnochrobactrum spirostomi]MQT13827.1 aminopeptidase P family protein [Segnochrobactrum spirostomi]
MFQSFEDVANPSTGAPRLARLRERLAVAGLDGFIVPRADEQQNEYVPPAAERLAWLTGFTGSAGIAVVLTDQAAVFVDGRYTVQAAAQIDPAAFSVCSLTDLPPSRWLGERLKPGLRIGYDAALHTIASVRRFRAACEAKGAAFVPVAANPLDEAWEDRPALPLGTVMLQPIELAGEDVAAKLSRLDALIGDAGADATVLTQPDSIAWTFNIRGTDVAHNPVPLAFAVLHRGKRPSLFVDGRKLSNAVRDALEAVADVAEPGAFGPALEALGARGTTVLLDPEWVSDLVARRIADAGGKIVEGRDPVILPKAVKNAVEIAGTRTAHLRDAAAMARFLAWLDIEAPKGGLDEITVAERLEAIRAETGALKDISFDTISAAGPNAALPHYRVTRSSNRPVARDEILLVDSGAQYQDGTTDITRTIIVGEPTDEMRDRFTRVLLGHIAISTARFPEGTSGAQLDPLARIALWRAGLDFDHGTGHGVGSYLSVHEGPQRISKLGTTPLEPGMILSNEPGFYKPGDYGIRIENLILVTAPAIPDGGDRPMLGFEVLTFAPIDKRLVDVDLLGRDGRDWLDAYHAEVFAKVAPLVDQETRTWLAEATAPIVR